MGGLSAHDAAAYYALGVLHRDAAFGSLYKDNEGDYHHHHHQHHDESEDTPLFGDKYVDVEIADRTRYTDHNAGEDDQRHAVADTAFGNLFTQPHNESSTGGERQDGQQNEANTRIDDDLILHAFEANRNTERLRDTQTDGQVAGPLRDLSTPQLAFLRQFLERGNYDREQLQNDRRSDVGHDAQGKNRQPANIAAGKQIKESKNGTLGAGEEFIPLDDVDAGRGNETAQPIDRQHGQREQDAPPQVRNAEHVPDRFKQLAHSYALSPRAG